MGGPVFALKAQYMSAQGQNAKRAPPWGRSQKSMHPVSGARTGEYRSGARSQKAPVCGALAGHIRFMMPTQGGARFAFWPWAGVYSAFSATEPERQDLTERSSCRTLLGGRRISSSLSSSSKAPKRDEYDETAGRTFSSTASGMARMTTTQKRG